MITANEPQLSCGQKDQDSWLEQLPAWAILLVVFALWLVSPFLLGKFIPDMATRGQFGDAYAVLNTLYSGLAFAAVFYAIVLQRRQLMVQQEELRLTRDEFIKSRSANVLFEGHEDPSGTSPLVA